MGTLQLFFLGPFDIRSGEQQMPRPPTQKSQSLLGYLVCHRKHRLPREHLSGLFFGDRPERNARHSLSTALWHIHRCLPSDIVFLNDSQNVQLSSNNIWLDVEAFEGLLTHDDPPSLNAAVALYRGDFLDGFYDDWVISERYRLESLYLSALARLMGLNESSRNYQAALAAALRLLSRDALREDAHQVAIRTYCHLGQRKSALDQYARCCQALHEELGTTPMRETTQLYQAIVSREFIPDRTPSEISLGSPSPEPKARSPLDVASTIQLVGREHEILFLQNIWNQVPSGSRLILISGEVGVGKTRLTEELAKRLSWLGFPVLWGRCYEFERSLPYQPFADALWSSIPTISDAELSGLPTWVLREAARLAPDLIDRPVFKKALAAQPPVSPDEAGLVLPPSPGTDLGQMRLFEGLARLLVRLSSNKKALLIVLEDLHWASESSLQMLHFLAHHLSTHPVMIIGTYRTEAVNGQHPLRILSGQLAHQGLAQCLQLDRLSPESIYSILSQMSGLNEALKPLADRLYQETEGNPFFLMEILKTLFETNLIHLHQGVWEGDFHEISRVTFPPSNNVSEAVQARVQRLDGKTQEALQHAAVLGREFGFEVLNPMLGQGEEATLEILDELLRHRLIEEKAGPDESDFSFTHHKIQEVVYQSTQRRRRAYLHAQAGAAIEQVYAAHRELQATELAFHFERACQLYPSLSNKAVHYLHLAGKSAVRQSANHEAVAYYQRALTILEAQPETDTRMYQAVELLLALAVPVTAIGGYVSPEAKSVFSKAYDLCQKLGQTPDLCTSLVGLARYYGLTGNMEISKKLSEQLYSIAQQSGDADLLVEAHRQVGAYLFSFGRLQECRETWERGLALYNPAQHAHNADRFGHDIMVTFLSYLCLTLWLQGYADQSTEYHRELLGRISTMMHPSSRAYAYCHLAVQACLYNSPQAALDYSEAAIKLGIVHGLVSWAHLAASLKGWAMCELRMEPKEGMKLLHDNILAWQTKGFTHLTPILLSLQAKVYLQHQRLEEAIGSARAALELVQSGSDGFWLAEILRLVGDLLFRNGDDGNIVEAYYNQANEIARLQGAKMLELRATISLARLLMAQGQAAEARRVLSAIFNQFNESFQNDDVLAASTLLKKLEEPEGII